MKTKLLGVIATVSLLSEISLAFAATLDVTYTGKITDGYDTTGLLGSAGSLVGDVATISFAFDLSQGIYSSSASSSSFMSFGPATGRGPVQTEFSLNNGGATGFSNSPNGVAVDQATAGTTNQSISLVLPQYNETYSIIAAAFDRSIPASILQDFTLMNVDLSVAFSFTGAANPYCDACNFNVYGDLARGDISVQYVPSPAPLPAAFPLFATGLGVMGLLGWRRKRKATAAVAAA
jgi:hypothetical protein